MASLFRGLHAPEELKVTSVKSLIHFGTDRPRSHVDGLIVIRRRQLLKVDWDYEEANIIPLPESTLEDGSIEMKGEDSNDMKEDIIHVR